MKFAVLILALGLMGCINRRPQVRIPGDCMKVRITDFTKPCLQLKDGDLICDGVRVRVNCIRAK